MVQAGTLCYVKYLFLYQYFKEGLVRGGSGYDIGLCEIFRFLLFAMLKYFISAMLNKASLLSPIISRCYVNILYLLYNFMETV